MIVNIGRYRLRRYDSRNWVLEEWREPKPSPRTKSADTLDASEVDGK